MNLAIDLLKEYDEKTSARVEKLENQIDQYEDALGTYLVKLSERDLSVKDSRILSVLLHCIGDFERISDHAVNIRDAAVEMNKRICSSQTRQSRNFLYFPMRFVTLSTGRYLPLRQEILALPKK